MKKNKIAIIGLVIVGAVSVINLAIAYSGEAGSETDPLVSASFVEHKIAGVRTSVENITNQVTNNTKKIEDLYVKMGNINNGNKGNECTTVELSKGTKVMIGANTEFIIRTGGANIVDTENISGVPNLSNGSNGVDGEGIVLNNIYFVANEDGRGFVVTQDHTWVVIRGTGNIIEE